MEPAEAFPRDRVDLFPPEAPRLKDYYFTVQVDGNRLKLAAHRASLRHPVPQAGEVVALRSSTGKGTHEMLGKVVEVRREAYVSVEVEQAGKIEKVLGRVHPRVPVRLPVRIERLTSGPLDVFTEDLSLGGFRALSPRAIRANRAMRALMDMGPSLGTVYSLAKAVRCEQTEARNYTIGFAFIDLQESDCQRIESLMERLAEGSPFQPSPGFPHSVSNLNLAFDTDQVFRARMVQVLKSPDYGACCTSRDSDGMKTWT